MSALSLPRGARELGVRVKPILTLSIGLPPGDGRKAPTAIEYFRAADPNTDEAIRFHAHYGDQPKELDGLRLPAHRDRALQIRYTAFKGGGQGQPGVLVALGQTNFGVMDYCGGPDTLQVWNPDGTVAYAETAGLDALTGEPLDQLAKDLGLELQTTFTFMLPAVIPLGQFAVVRTKSKESTDNLHFHTATYYGLFGAKVPFVLRPTLVLKPTTMRPVIQTQDGPQRIRRESWALDLLLPETEEEMLGRAHEMNALLAGEPIQALYGPNAAPPVRGELPAPAEVSTGSPIPRTDDGPAAVTAEEVAESVPPSALPTSEPVMTPESDDDIKTAAIVAAKWRIPTAQHEGKTIGDIYQMGKGKPHQWIAWLAAGAAGANAEKWAGGPEAAMTFCRFYLPDIYNAVLTERSAANA